MSLASKRPQKSGQPELPTGAEGETPSASGGGELRAAVKGTERSGTSDLLEKVLQRPNLQAALKRVKKNRGSPGIDGMAVDELPAYLKENWLQLREQLRAGKYQPQPVRRQQIPKSGGGVRELGIPTVLDRFIQQALLQVLQPIFDPTFSEHSFGFRPGRSAHDAVKTAQSFIEEGREVVVDVDLEKFFDRVNHDVLMGRLAKRIEDKEVLRLIRRYLEAGIMSDGVVVSRDEGTPQGGPLSPLLANVLLDEVDKELEKRGHAFVRYADDSRVYVKSERAGERVMKHLVKMYERLRLRVNEEKSAVASAFSRPFLSFSFWKTKEGQVKRRVAEKAKKALKKRVREDTKRTRGRSMMQVVEGLRPYMLGWRGYFRLAEAPREFQTLDGWIRRRLRALQLYHWKNGRTIYRELMALGAWPETAAKVAVNGHRRWWNSRMGLNRALPNRYFDQLGLPRLAT